MSATVFNHVLNRLELHSKKIYKLLTALAITTLFITSFHFFGSTQDDITTTFRKEESGPSFLPSREILRYLKRERNIDQQYHLYKDESGVELLDFNREEIKVIQPEVIDHIYENIDIYSVDWSRFAYVLYATSSTAMCNAMMMLSELKRFGSRAKRVMIVNREFLDEATNPKEYKSLTTFAKDYDVKLKPAGVIQVGGGSSYWLSSFTKLLVFNETEYDRVIYMDSDAVLTRSHFDELFFLPPCKIAVPTGYWLVKDKLLREKLSEKYNPNDYGFKPLTKSQRRTKVSQFVNDHINAFVDPESEHLPIQRAEFAAALDTVVNERNFYTNIYNNLPSYPSIDEFSLTNIVMVIQPSAELYRRVELALESRRENEFDMDLVHYHMFPLRKVLRHQVSNSANNAPDLTFGERLEEIPELIILPHQVYGTLTSELNIETSHYSYLAEAHDQAFALQLPDTVTRDPAYYSIEGEDSPGDTIFQLSKYLHFSDHPIPKPWHKLRLQAGYMAYRTRCPNHGDFSATDDRVKPSTQCEDCSAGQHWEEAHRMFAKQRKDICGLDQIDTTEDMYSNEIN
jgi:alpha-N-acetylglucosamine transferase